MSGRWVYDRRVFLSKLLQKSGPFLGEQPRRGWRACEVRGYLAAAQPCPQLLHVLRGLLLLGVAQMSLLLQGPFPLLEAEVVLGDLHDPLYQLAGVGDKEEDVSGQRVPLGNGRRTAARILPQWARRKALRRWL